MRYGHPLVYFKYHTRMANSALKCRIVILITARSFCNYNNILIKYGQLYSNSCYTTFSVATLRMCIACEFHQSLGSEALYLSHVLSPHKMTYFVPNWPCGYGSHYWQSDRTLQFCKGLSLMTTGNRLCHSTQMFCVQELNRLKLRRCYKVTFAFGPPY